MTSPDTATLVERLRDMKMGDAVTVACELDDLCQEAADALEQRDARIAELEAERDRLVEDRAQFPNRPDDIGRMIGARFRNLETCKKSADEHALRALGRAAIAESEAAALRVRVGELEEALCACVFLIEAAHSDARDDYMPGVTDVELYPNGSYMLSRARALLAGNKEEK